MIAANKILETWWRPALKELHALRPVCFGQASLLSENHIETVDAISSGYCSVPLSNSEKFLESTPSGEHAATAS